MGCTSRGRHSPRASLFGLPMVSALDVVVDLRHGSATYGKSLALEISAQNHKILWVPEGFAHGFLSLEDGTVFFVSGDQRLR